MFKRDVIRPLLNLRPRKERNNLNAELQFGIVIKSLEINKILFQHEMSFYKFV